MRKPQPSPQNGAAPVADASERCGTGSAGSITAPRSAGFCRSGHMSWKMKARKAGCV